MLKLLALYPLSNYKYVLRIFITIYTYIMYTIACFSSQNIRLADDGLITLLFGNIEVGSTANLRICEMLGMYPF